jgi:hypothetical protein
MYHAGQIELKSMANCSAVYMWYINHMDDPQSSWCLQLVQAQYSHLPNTLNQTFSNTHTHHA